MVPDRRPLRVSSFTMQCWIWPTMPKTHPRLLVSTASRDHGANGPTTGATGCSSTWTDACELRINGQTVIRTGEPVRDQAWHFMRGDVRRRDGRIYCAIMSHRFVYALDPVTRTGRIGARHGLAEHTRRAVHVRRPSRVAPSDPHAASRLPMPAGTSSTDHYNGKIDSPRICASALTRLEIETMKPGAQPGLSEGDEVPDRPESSGRRSSQPGISDGHTTPHHRRRTGPLSVRRDLVKLPDAGMTGLQLGRREFDWRARHRDNTGPSISTTMTSTTRDGQVISNGRCPGRPAQVYAAKLTSKDGDEDYIPFWVVAAVGEETSKIAFMVPTISYMAYANEHLANNAGGAELLVYRVPIMQQQNMFLSEHREYGGSIYDTHTDGSGLCLSSRLRPILSIRPKYDHFLAQAPWQYPADLHMIYWLEKMGYKYDVITDEDVSYDGLARLENYNVVISGSHPEHNSGPQLDALHNYMQRGGRFMYMGADGWYWVHSYHPGYDGIGRGVVTEMRRCESGIRTWRADPGEYYHQGTGELGGMWRFRGRYLPRSPAPACRRKASTSRPIIRGRRRATMPASPGHSRASPTTRSSAISAWSAAEPPAPNSTSSIRCSAARRTRWWWRHPPAVTPKATCWSWRDYGFNQQGLDGTQHPRVAPDIAYHETPNGGASFAFSSIAFCGALPWNNGDNNISKLVGNVLNRFMKDGPLPAPDTAEVHSRGRFASTPALNYHLPGDVGG